MTSHEVAFATQHNNNYYVYRVYDFDQTSHVGKLYVRRGAIEAAFRRTAVPYRVMPTSVITLASQRD